jgi:hypothetical protein
MSAARAMFEGWVRMVRVAKLSAHRLTIVESPQCAGQVLCGAQKCELGLTSAWRHSTWASRHVAMQCCCHARHVSGKHKLSAHACALRVRALPHVPHSLHYAPSELPDDASGNIVCSLRHCGRNTRLVLVDEGFGLKFGF